MKIQITREWLESKLDQLLDANTDELTIDVNEIVKAPPDPVMVCKLQLHEMAPKQLNAGCDKDNKFTLPVTTVQFGAVWAGTAERQAASENAVFGHWTPYADFRASICNEAVIDKLVKGKAHYVKFFEVPEE